jgi:inosine-uridine nucleoside N-ribohydrolase
MRKAKQIVIMGGCTSEIPAYDMTSRQGNIKPYAEFNFYMAPSDAQQVLSSDLPIVLMPMNCTQQLSLTPERESILKNCLSSHSERAEKIIAMMSAPAALDREKFNASPFMHDVHTALFLIAPQQYQGHKGFVSVQTAEEEKGRTIFQPHEAGNVHVMEKVMSPDHLFTLFTNALTNIFPPPTDSPVFKAQEGPQGP